MINRNDLVPIGQFIKPHGIKGEIIFSYTNDSFTTSECPFLICEMDGIYVPFRIVNFRLISNSTAFIQLKNIDSEQTARIFSKKEVFFPENHTKENIENDSFTWDYFIGFTLIDEQLGKIGRIVDVDTTTINTLFIIEKGGDEILIPAVEEFVIRIDENMKEIFVFLPEGLVE
jgi:16S rRNA processing protein RimM